MKILATQDLFASEIRKRNIHRDLGVSSSTVRSIRARIKKGQFPSHETMSTYLRNLGYLVAIPECWIHRLEESRLTYTQRKIQSILLDPNFDPDIKKILEQNNERRK